MQVIDTRARGDRAHFIRALLEGRYRDAEKVVLVMDRLNTHSPASLGEVFPPAEAAQLAARLEVHHTPKHGGWLNMVESELSAFARNLPEQVGDRAVPVRHAACWIAHRNVAGVRADRQLPPMHARSCTGRHLPDYQSMRTVY